MQEALDLSFDRLLIMMTVDTSENFETGFN